MMRPGRIHMVGMIVFFFASSVAMAAHAWFSAEPASVGFNIGACRVFDGDQEFIWGVEYRPAFRFHHIGTWYLLQMAEYGEFYAAAGVLTDIHLSPTWYLTPSFGAGYYDDSGHYELGYEIEFRSGIELTRTFHEGHRVGIALVHLSNGPLGNRNPGVEWLYLKYSFPLNYLFNRSARKQCVNSKTISPPRP